MNEKSIFEKIIAKEIVSNIIYETDRVIVLYPISVLVQGHSLVIPKHPYKDLFETMKEEDSAAVIKEINKVSNIIRTTLNADAVNLICASGVDAGQEVMHLHFHLIPRYKDDELEVHIGESNLHKSLLTNPDMDVFEQLKAAA